jgi:hypothetical protein
MFILRLSLDKIKYEFHTYNNKSTCLLNLNQFIDTVGSSNLLDLIFSNISDISIAPGDPELIKPDNYHPPLIFNIILPPATSTQKYIL